MYTNINRDRNFELAFKDEVIKSITGATVNSEEVTIETESGKIFRMYHEQDCCEYVRVAGISDMGKISVDAAAFCVIGKPVLETKQFVKELPEASESGTMTEFIIKTETGQLNIVWYGESNGYYSESVSFILVSEPDTQ